MENDANYALVGIISTAIIVALFGFIYWFAGPSLSVATKSYDVVFTGTVTGIGSGTDVLFNGIKVGQVRDVILDPADTNRVIAHIEVGANTPVKTDTRALLSVQGLTGIGSIQLSGGSKGAAEPVPAEGQTVPVLYAEKSDFQSILDGLTTTISGAADTVERLNTFLEQNDSKLSASISNVETFSAALAANSDGVQDFLAGVAEAGKQIAPVASEIRGLSTDLRALIAAVPAEQVAKVVSNVTTFSDSLARNSSQIDVMVASTTSAAKELNDMTTELKPSITAINAVTKQIDPAVVGRVIGNIDAFSSEARDLSVELRSLIAAVPPEQVTKVVGNVTVFSDSLARNAGQIDDLMASTTNAAKDINEITTALKPSIAAIEQVTKQIDPAAVGRVVGNFDTFSKTLSDNSDDINVIVANVTELSKSLNGSAARIDAVLARIDGVVSGANDEGLFEEIKQAAKSVRVLADQLNSSTSQIAVGLNNFTSKGLSEYSTLAVDARGTLARLDRVVRNLERNPQSLVFGGETVREYNKK